MNGVWTWLINTKRNTFLFCFKFIFKSTQFACKDVVRYSIDLEEKCGLTMNGWDANERKSIRNIPYILSFASQRFTCKNEVRNKPKNNKTKRTYLNFVFARASSFESWRNRCIQEKAIFGRISNVSTKRCHNMHPQVIIGIRLKRNGMREWAQGDLMRLIAIANMKRAMNSNFSMIYSATG